MGMSIAYFFPLGWGDEDSMGPTFIRVINVTSLD